jgi:hypothetical protein
MEMFKIVSRWNSNKILYQAEAESFRALILAAIKAGANLRGTDLSNADLSSADLRGTDLSNADLSSANLRGTDLSSANLSNADLSNADLSNANLSSADLRGTDLSNADLSNANLRGTDLRGANLRGTDLSNADLYGAENAKLSLAQTSIVPEHGAFIGWKLCQDSVLVQVQIPADAKRSNASGRKCRAEYVTVLDVIGASKGISKHDNKTTYVKDEIVRCDKWEEDRFVECGGGIHFFLTRIEAENYN